MANSPQIVISISALEQQIHQLINQERQQYNLTLLTFDSKLSYIARQHSQDMALRNFLSHKTPEGTTPTERGNAAGYACRKNYGNYYTEGIAENIFMSHLYSSITYYNGVPHHNWMSQIDIAKSTVMGWMSSPGHRQNILTATYDKQGIGVAVSQERNQVYITQNFC